MKNIRENIRDIKTRMREQNMYLIRIPERDNRENGEKVVFEKVIDNL